MLFLALYRIFKSMEPLSFQEYKLDILCLSETKLSGEGGLGVLEGLNLW